MKSPHNSKTGETWFPDSPESGSQNYSEFRNVTSWFFCVVLRAR